METLETDQRPLGEPLADAVARPQRSVATIRLSGSATGARVVGARRIAFIANALPRRWRHRHLHHRPPAGDPGLGAAPLDRHSAPWSSLDEAWRGPRRRRISIIRRDGHPTASDPMPPARYPI